MLPEKEDIQNEFKSSFNDETIKTLVAFANTKGGSIYIGVTNTKRIIGVDLGNETTQRTEIPEYPLEAIREILLNTLIHRDYQNPTDVQIKIFNNSISFFNPSGLYGNITIEELQTDKYRASTRNKQLAEAFYLTKDIEKYGSGFFRIRKNISDYATMTFEYENTGHGFISELKYTIQKTSLNKSNPKDGIKGEIKDGINFKKQTILFFIKENPYITIAKLSKALGITKRSIEIFLINLKKEGLIKRVGSRKTGYWQISDDE